MPKYYFPIVDGTKLVDPVGLELQNEEQAKRQAELIAKYVALTGAKARHIVVEDGEGTEIHKEPVKPESPIR
ncbi:DUF6894 family protein [Tardiphaga sp. 804_B3_N1_9]|uniref:DUF6894 family protein n=1 Tax=Tardiphaga TaxID=1395974 RepID=UPI001586D67A|nr:hypothetical protein [Tardiphaga robiniae]NUU39907.1 hypothetical protein [Tardiphaga robiniae]